MLILFLMFFSCMKIQYDFLYIFEGLGRLYENKKHFFIFYFMQCFRENQVFYYRFVYLQCKTTNQY